MSLTERCLAELELAGGRMREIASRLGEDQEDVRKALCNLRRAKRINAKRVPCERRVYYYFSLADEFELPSITKPKRSSKKRARKPRKAGHVYFRQMRW